MTRGGPRRPLRVVVAVVEGLTLAAAVVAVVMLFANEPGAPPAADQAAAPAEGDGGGAGAVDGATVFADRCASCHGADGGGGVGPTLSGGAVVAAYPDPADQVVVVTEGRLGMPAFGGLLSAEEIDAVVAYTRSL